MGKTPTATEIAIQLAIENERLKMLQMLKEQGKEESIIAIEKLLKQ